MPLNHLPPSAVSAGIFRHTLYLPSERFIPDQAAAFENTNVTMFARDEIVDADDRLRGVSLSSQGRTAVLKHTLLMDPGPLTRLVLQEGVGVLHAHFGVEGMYSRAAAARADIPHVVTLHGFDVSLSPRALRRSMKPAWQYYSTKRGQLMKSGSAFVCVSSHVQRLAVALGANPENTFVIGTGVDTRHIAFSSLPETPTIVHVARLVEKKGTEVLIRAFAVVLSKVPEARLSIVGTGPLLPALKSLAADLQIDHRVDFLGPKSHADVLDAIASARVLCLPSVTAKSGDQEGLGQVLLEAGAIGRPVVATVHGGITDGVHDGETGILVPERNVGELAEALVEILASDKFAARLGKAAREFVVREFDLRSQARKVESLYRSLL